MQEDYLSKTGSYEFPPNDNITTDDQEKLADRVKELENKVSVGPLFKPTG